MELVGFLFPPKDDPYYVWQVWDSFLRSAAIGKRFGDEDRAKEMLNRLSELKRAYPVIDEWEGKRNGTTHERSPSGPGSASSDLDP